MKRNALGQLVAIPIEERFWLKVDKTGECSKWTGARDAFGYGAARLRGVQVSTHRIAWELANGLIPQGMFVCHRCDCPACVKPEHLFLATHDENMADMVAKGRGANQNTGKDRCKRGHLFTPENTGTVKVRHRDRIGRRCLTCERDRLAARYAAAKTLSPTEKEEP